MSDTPGQRDHGSEADALFLREVEHAALSRDLNRAVELAREGLARGLVNPLLLNLRASWLEQQGRDHEALADLEKARELAPDDINVLNALGLCLTKLERMDEAITVFGRVRELQPDFAPAYFNQGQAHESLRQMEAANRCYEQALAVNPRYAEPASALSWHAARRRDWKATRHHGERALAIDPRQITASLALVRADIEEKHFADAERRLTGLTADMSLAPTDRYFVGGLLGDLRHAQGRYAEAFAAYSSSNVEYKQSSAATRFRTAQTAADAIRWLTRYFGNLSQPWPRAPEQAEDRPCLTHVFLTGFPRSGTSLLEHVLAGHPGIVTLEEREAFIESAREFMAHRSDLHRLAAAPEAELARFREMYWRHIREFGIDPAGKVFIDKQPFHTTKLPLVAKLFPQAKVLFVLRDPRDVVLSCFRHRFRVNAYMYEMLTLEGAARFYEACMQLAALYREKLPLNLKTFRHEDLVVDFETEGRAICAFLGIEWNDGMRNFAERARSGKVMTPSSPQLARGLTQEGIGQWRRYAKELAPILPVLKPWVERFGYPPD